MFKRKILKRKVLTIWQIARKQGRKVVFSGLVIIAALGAGFFYYWNFYETPVEKWDEAKYSPAEDYKVIESEDGIFIENKKAGISFKVPDEWRVEKEKFYIALYSPNAKGAAREGVIENGCEIIVDSQKIKTSIDVLKKHLQDLHKDWAYNEKYQIVEIGGQRGLKNVTGIPQLNLYGAGIHIPYQTPFLQNWVYYVSISANGDDFDFCKEIFEDFVKTVSIQ